MFIGRVQAEIDILGEQDKSTALFGECKWTKEKVDLGVLETLSHCGSCEIMVRYNL